MGGPRSSAAESLSVALVGFMAGGKSAVGRALAERLGEPFVDCDGEIELRHGAIPDIFSSVGEAGFRRLEAAVTLETLEHALAAPEVVALGGGAVQSAEVRAAVRRLPEVVWLTAPASVLWARAAAARGTRPLAVDESAFAELLRCREALYREVATMSVVNDGARSVDLVADEIVGRLDVRGKQNATRREAR